MRLELTDDPCRGCGSALWTNGAVVACPRCDRPRCCHCRQPYGPLLAAPILDDANAATIAARRVEWCEHCGRQVVGCRAPQSSP